MELLDSCPVGRGRPDEYTFCIFGSRAGLCVVVQLGAGLLRMPAFVLR